MNAGSTEPVRAVSAPSTASSFLDFDGYQISENLGGRKSKAENEHLLVLLPFNVGALS